MLGRKMLRDLNQNRTQFVSIFLMAFLGMLIFCGMDTESAGLKISFESYYERQNLADLFVYKERISEADEKAVQGMAGVEQAERRFVVEGTAKREGDPKMTLLFLRGEEISRPYVMSSLPFSAEESGVWLDAEFARVNGIEIGEQMTFEWNETELCAEVRGLIRHPEFVYYVEDAGSMMPEYGKYGFAVFPVSEYPNATGEMPCNQMVLTLKDHADPESVRRNLEEYFGTDSAVVGDRKSNTGYVTAEAEYEQHRMMAYMFPTVFLLIAVLGIITTMTRMTASQRTVIGTLKALGFSKGRITLHYVSFGFWVSLAGSLAGAYVGYLWLPDYMDNMMKEYYLIPEYLRIPSENSYVAVAISVLVAVSVSFFACRKELKENPALTLKPKLPGKQKNGWLEKSPLWKHLEFSFRWNWRDITRNRVRTLMGMTGVAGCCMLLVCAFGCNDSMKDMGTWMYGELISCKNRILFEEGTAFRDVREYAQKYHGQMIEEVSVEFLKPDRSRKSGVLTVTEPGGYVHYQNSNLEEFSLRDGETAISYKLARAIGAKEGEFVRWRPVGEEKWQTFRVGRIYRTASGQGIAMTRNTYEELHFSFVPTAVLTNQSVPESITDEDCVLGVQKIGQMRDGMEKNMESMNQMVAILIVAAVLLGVVVLHNLGVLSYVEKTREIATLKVLGFQTWKIRMILQKQNIWVTTAGILAGLPAGYAFLAAICDTLSEEQDMVTIVTIPSYVMAILGTFLVSILVNALLSARVRKIDMVEALKGAE